MVNNAPFSILLQGAGDRKRGSMDKDFENLVSNRNDARYELQQAQTKVLSTSDELIRYCIEHKRIQFLKLDDAELSRYQRDLHQR